MAPSGLVWSLLYPALFLAGGAIAYESCSAADRDLTQVECNQGEWDCAYCGISKKAKATTCADYRGVDAPLEGQVWIVIVGGIVACLMAFAIGGNDAANSWGTAVGSGAIPVAYACMLGGVGEFLGATLLGYGVSGTIQKGVSNPTDGNCWACGHCDSKMNMYQFGMFAALCGAASFLLVVTFVALPISTTHSIVGGVVGMTAAAIGWNCLNWSMTGLGGIFLSWVVSPLLAGIIGVIMYVFTYLIVFKAKDPVKNAFLLVPFLFGLITAVLVLMVMLKSTSTKNMDIGVKLIVSAVSFVVVMVISHFLVMPRVRKQVSEMQSEANSQNSSASSSTGSMNPPLDIPSPPPSLSELPESNEQKPPDEAVPTPKGMALFTLAVPTAEQRMARKTFQILLVYTAFLESFAHGSNDTANATGPFTALYTTYQDGRYACKTQNTPWYIMAVGGAFVALGMNIMGYRVITTMGKKITQVDFHIAFCTEFASAFAVITGTLANMPVSTTHCQVGAVVFIGCVASGFKNVSWPMFGQIALSWVVTLPISGGIAALMMFFRFFI